ncbi:MAG TPA: type III-B CRISPR module-associated protein Cmr5 [Clostridiales bacterium]|nr:type III-B CRISPR module-associated protein Cmr5 [Clostridiales bacterium]
MSYDSFIKGKGSSLDVDGKAYKRLYKGIGEWLKSTDCPVNSVYDANKRDLMDIVVSLNSDEYRVMTKEIMEFVNWLRRFAKGMIGDEN